MPLTAHQIRRKDLLAMNSALGVLAKKTLPSLPAELKVAKLIKAIRPTVEAINEALAKFSEANSKDDGNGNRVPLNAFEYNKLTDAELVKDEEVSLPDTRITKDDLPAALKGEKGDANREMNAGVIADLGFLFTTPED